MKLIINVADKSDRKVFCKVVISKLGAYGQDSSLLQSCYCNGSSAFDLEQGKYNVEIYRGKLYDPFQKVLEIEKEDISLDVRLHEVLNIKALHLYSFDAHSHVSRDEVLDTGNLATASTVMKGEDFNFFFAGSPYDHEVHLQYLEKNFTDQVSYREKFVEVIKDVSNESYVLDIGNEIVKCRYGHAFLMNYIQKPPFSKYYDEEWDPWFFTKIGDEPTYSIAYMYEALLAERGDNSVAAAAHPTSWWWHDNGEFVTNIAATLGFEILAGSIDAMVVMGYDKDHKYYQELWFEALKNGYFLPGIAETDASFDVPPKRFIEFKTYAMIDSLNIDSLCEAVRKGKCIVSSGPIVLMKVNGNDPGAVLTFVPGEVFNVELFAHRCFQQALSKVQIILNGEVYKEFIIDKDEFEMSETVKIEQDSFILVKCYDGVGNVAMTNPVYIRNQPFLNQGYKSNVCAHVYENGVGVKGAYWLEGNDELVSFDSEIRVSMKVASKLFIAVDGKVKVIRLFELPELQKIFQNLYFGWFNKDRRYNPGEVPASEFKLAEIREILDHVEIDLNF